MTIDERLKNGFRDFFGQDYQQNKHLYKDLADNGQSPHTIVIACSDSRVQVDKILGAQPGELFVVRNVAAMVPPFEQDSGYHGTSAAIEFAVTALKVDNIVVMGHAGCGGVASVIDTEMNEESFVSHWMRPLRQWLADSGDKLPQDTDTRKTMLERASVLQSIKNLHDFPFVRDAVAAGKLKVEGLLFEVATGDLSRVRAGKDGNYTVQNVLEDE